MPSIQRLSAEVVSRIAAGEVIERPASVLKELIENSLDAKASRIDVEIQKSGKKLIRVRDDGTGMDSKDCDLCLERHATSKIAQAEDLDNLRTYGFRGEALFAIASISKLQITSAVRKAKSGWHIEAEAGRVTSSKPAPPISGTIIEISDLFFNAPARLKFLKSDNLERSKLSAVIEEAALAHPEIGFFGKSEGRTVWKWEAEKSADLVERLRTRASAVLGEEIVGSLIPVQAQRPGFKFTFFISEAENLSASRRFQHWFVNGRPIESRSLQQTLYRAYAPYRGTNRHPVCLGFIEIEPDLFDANVHPAKREIRFKAEREILDTLFSTVEAALRRGPIVLSTPSFKNETLVEERKVPYIPWPRPTLSKRAAPLSAAPRYEEQNSSLNLPLLATASFQKGTDDPLWFTPPYRYLGQIESSYLVFDAAGGLFVLDQHAAAERVLFEKLVEELESGRIPSQKLMLPWILELPPSKIQDILTHKEILERLGFELDLFGAKRLRVLSAPAPLKAPADFKEVFHRLLDVWTSPSEALKEAQQKTLATVACKAAIKAHDVISEKEALKLLEDLRKCPNSNTCPHGRKAFFAFNRGELARKFDRPGPPPL